MTLEVVSGVVAAALSGMFSLAQVFHIWKKRSTAGLSDVSWLLLCLTFTAWLTWGVLRADPYLIATNAASLLGTTYVLWAIRRDAGLPLRRVAGTVVVAGVAFALQVAGSTAGALVGVLCITGFIRRRQQRTVRQALDLSGVALSPWLISSVAQVVWFIHGVSAGKLVLAAHAPFAIAANTVLLWSVIQRRRGLIEGQQPETC